MASVDTVDGQPSEPVRANAFITQLKLKIHRITELINDEQRKKERSLNEYLRLSPVSDKQHKQKLKAVFESNNQKSTQNISKLQKKLEKYETKLVGVKTHGVSREHKHVKEVFHDMGQSVKHNVKEAKDAIASKRKDLAHLLVIKKPLCNTDSLVTHKGSPSPAEKLESKSYGKNMSPVFKFDHVDKGNGSNATSNRLTDSQSTPHEHLNEHVEPHITQAELANFMQKVNRKLGINDENEGAEISVHVYHELAMYKGILEDECDRSERIEAHLNDLIDLHQHEVNNIKQELCSMEEKMEYQLAERTNDMQELLESCHTKIKKLELQQEHQYFVSMEGFQDSNFKALTVKLINVVLAILAVIFLIVSAATNFMSPFFKTRSRILTTIILIVFIIAVLKGWPLVSNTSDTIHKIFAIVFK